MPEHSKIRWIFFPVSYRSYVGLSCVHRVCMFTVISGVSIILCLHWFIGIHWGFFFVPVDISSYSVPFFQALNIVHVLSIEMNGKKRIQNNRSLLASNVIIANNRIESIWLYHKHGSYTNTYTYFAPFRWSWIVYLKIYFLMENIFARKRLSYTIHIFFPLWRYMLCLYFEIAYETHANRHVVRLPYYLCNVFKKKKMWRKCVWNEALPGACDKRF